MKVVSKGMRLSWYDVGPHTEEFVSKTSYIHFDMLLIRIIDFLLQLK